jgi:hypothetical protein
VIGGLTRIVPFVGEHSSLRGRGKRPGDRRDRLGSARARLECDCDGLLCSSVPHVAMVEHAQARQRNQGGVGSRFCLDGPPMRGVFVQRIVNPVLVASAAETCPVLFASG